MKKLLKYVLVIVFGITAGLAALNTRSANDDLRNSAREPRAPIVIGHRGASGYFPEHTLAAYAMAILQGADYVEPDLVITKDGVLVARHENEIGGTTNVAEHAEWASRRGTKTIDGVAVTGWFTEDFTLAELKTLRAKERIPEIRPANTRFDGMFEIPTLDEVLALVAAFNEQRRGSGSEKQGRNVRPIGVYPETKHPTYFQQLGLPLEEPLVRALDRWALKSARDEVFIQSFETANLKKLARMTRVRLVQLISDTGKPWDFVVANDPRTYSDLARPAGLQEIARYAAGIAPHKNLMIPRSRGSLGRPTSLASDARKVGLVVHAWTFRAENRFLPNDFRSSSDPAAVGELAGEIRRFLELGLDGFFTDHPDIGVRARDPFVSR